MNEKYHYAEVGDVYRTPRVSSWTFLVLEVTNDRMIFFADGKFYVAGRNIVGYYKL